MVVYYRLADDLPGRVEVIPYKADAMSPGSFMLVLTPGLDLQPRLQGVDYTFVLDVSGSMDSKLATLANGVQRALERLRTEDRFRLVTFSNAALEIRGMGPATAEAVREAYAMVAGLRSQGGTNLHEGLQAGLAKLDDDRAACVVLVTDGGTAHRLALAVGVKIGRWPWCTGLIALTALAVGGDGPLTAVLTLDRQAVLAGDWWRLLGGHLAHWSAGHLGWDLLAWLLIGTVAEVIAPRRFRLAIGAGALLVSLGVLALQPDLRWYRGLSGLVAVGFGVWVAAWWRSPRSDLRLLAALLLGGFMIKVLAEGLAGTRLFVGGTSYPPVPLAHGLGLLTGLVTVRPRRVERQQVTCSVVGPVSKSALP